MDAMTPLGQVDKDVDHLISSERVLAENIIRKGKVLFRIMGEPYRNRRKRFGLRLHLIALSVNAKSCWMTIAENGRSPAHHRTPSL